LSLIQISMVSSRHRNHGINSNFHSNSPIWEVSKKKNYYLRAFSERPTLHKKENKKQKKSTTHLFTTQLNFRRYTVPPSFFIIPNLSCYQVHNHSPSVPCVFLRPNPKTMQQLTKLFIFDPYAILWRTHGQFARYSLDIARFAQPLDFPKKKKQKKSTFSFEKVCWCQNSVLTVLFQISTSDVQGKLTCAHLPLVKHVPSCACVPIQTFD